MNVPQFLHLHGGAEYLPATSIVSMRKGSNTYTAALRDSGGSTSRRTKRKVGNELQII